MIAPLVDTAIRLPGGRTLAYAEWGDLSGRPVLFFHGMPGSRLSFPMPEVAAEAAVHVIAPDRPGMGRSDPQPGHRVADWPSDVSALADALDIERFGVIGWSAGTPYALACAALIPDRLTGVAVTTSAASIRYLFDEDAELREAVIDDDERAIIDALAHGSDTAERRAAADAAEFVQDLREHPEHLLEHPAADGDAWFFDDPERTESFVEGIREALRQGAEAMAPGFVAQVAPWGFRIEDIAMPAHVWAGAQDDVTSPDLMRRIADKIPTHEFTVWDDVGHIGIAKHLDQVLREL